MNVLIVTALLAVASAAPSNRYRVGRSYGSNSEVVLGYGSAPMPGYGMPTGKHISARVGSASYGTSGSTSYSGGAGGGGHRRSGGYIGGGVHSTGGGGGGVTYSGGGPSGGGHGGGGHIGGGHISGGHSGGGHISGSHSSAAGVTYSGGGPSGGGHISGGHSGGGHISGGHSGGGHSGGGHISGGHSGGGGVTYSGGGGFGGGGFGGGGFGGGGFGGGDCGSNEIRNSDGRCGVPDVQRKIYVFAAKQQPVRHAPLPAPEPEVNIDVILVKTPEDIPDTNPIVVPPPEQKTVVYVLSKRPEVSQEVIQIPSVPEDPEVYFVNYKEGENPALPGGIDLQTALTQAAVDPSGFINKPSQSGNYL